VKAKLGKLVVAEEPAAKSWYRTGSDDIPVLSKVRTSQVQPLSAYSKVLVGMMEKNNRVLLYVDRDSRDEAEKLIGRGN